jgi:flagellar motility protein MotE (MotC chaperone)
MEPKRYSLRAATLALLLILCLLASTSVTGADDIEELREELNSTKEELNQTKEELADVEEERDKYATRLEEQTQILIIVLVLIVLSYIFFFISAKRQRIMFEALKEGKLQVEGDVRPKRRRRRG